MQNEENRISFEEFKFNLPFPWLLFEVKLMKNTLIE